MRRFLLFGIAILPQAMPRLRNSALTPSAFAVRFILRDILMRLAVSS
jgi:hypothetical protein